MKVLLITFLLVCFTAGVSWGACEPCRDVTDGPNKGTYVHDPSAPALDCPGKCGYTKGTSKDVWCLKANGLWNTINCPSTKPTTKPAATTAAGTTAAPAATTAAAASGKVCVTGEAECKDCSSTNTINGVTYCCKDNGKCAGGTTISGTDCKCL